MVSTHRIGLCSIILIMATAAVASTPGDLNLDGCVDLADFADFEVYFTGPNCTPTVTPRLFVANYVASPSAGVLSYENPAARNGDVSPSTVVLGPATLLDFPAGIVVNPGGQLLVANLFEPSITTYDDAATLVGNPAPEGHLFGTATQLNHPWGMAITSADVLMVANPTSSQINTYTNTSAILDGDMAPTRSIVSLDLNIPYGINFDDGGNLYVANLGNSNVIVFANAVNLNGNVSPTRVIVSTEFDTVRDVFVDQADHLLVLDSADNEIYTFNNAATLNGVVSPDFVLSVTGAVFLQSIVVDSNNVGYIADSSNNAIYSYNNITTRNGFLNPDRTIQGTHTQLNTPVALFLTE